MCSSSSCFWVTALGASIITSGAFLFKMWIRDRPTRKADNAASFLEGCSVWLHADGYAGYHRLPENIRVVGCWAHLRRKFDEAVNALPKEQRAGCTALEGLEYCNALFGIEQELAGLPPEERYEQRLARSKPVMDALLAWAETKRCV